MTLVVPPSADLDDPARGDSERGTIQDAVIREARRRARRRRQIRGGLTAVIALALVAVAFNRPAPPQGSADVADRPSFVGPPPPGTPTTGPATGKLVAAAEFWMATWIYADGRMITVARDDIYHGFRGYAVRRLTPSGVEAMRSYILDGTPKLIPLSDNGGRLIVRVGDRLMEDRNYTGCVSAGQSRWCPDFDMPEDWLPASAWEDPVFRPFVPHTYQACMMDLRQFGPAELLPTEAANILLASPETESTREGTCWGVANPVARQLADIMNRADGYVPQESSDLVYQRQDDRGSLDFQLALSPELPQDDDFCWPVGNPCRPGTNS
jgi:hypothetical protein